MGYRILTNVPSITAQRHLGKANKTHADSIAKMASGSRITKAADDAAGLAISEKLKSQIRSYKQAGRNANDGISMVQTAEGGLTEITGMLTRMRELSIQAASDTIGGTERKFVDMEYQNLKEEIERVSRVTEYNGMKLLDGEGDRLDIQVGIRNDEFLDRISYDVDMTNARSEALGVSELSVLDKDGAREGLSALDTALDKVNSQRAQLGALQNRLQVTSQTIEVMNENNEAANSRIRDVDYAEETSNNTKWGIIKQAATSVLGQANHNTQNVMKLIG